MRKVEKEEEQLSYDDPVKKIFHLCIINLVIGLVRLLIFKKFYKISFNFIFIIFAFLVIIKNKISWYFFFI